MRTGETVAGPREAAIQLIETRLCDKAERLVCMLLGADTRVAVLTDTHMTQEETRLFNLHLALRGLTCAVPVKGAEPVCVGTPADERGQCGVLVVWDPVHVQMHFAADSGVVMPHRIVRANASFMLDGVAFTLFGAYMPVRGQPEGDVRPAWNLLAEAVEEEGDVCIGGDLNAELPHWLAKRGASATLADRLLRLLVEDEESPLAPLTGREATYREGTVGTQLDHWLVSSGLAGRFDTASTLPGICGDDHEVLVTYLHHMAAAGGEERPKGKWVLEKEEWEAFCKASRGAVAGALAEARSKGGEGKVGYWPRLMRALQTALINCAKQAKTIEDGEDNGSIGQDRPAGGGRAAGRAWGPSVAATKTERLRWQVGRWRRWRRRAEAWSGRVDKRRAGRGLGKLPELQGIIDGKVQFPSAARRREAAIKVCDCELRKAVQRLQDHQASPGAKGAGDRLLEKMKEALTGHTGNTLITLFKEVRLAMGKGNTGDARLMAVKDDDGKVVRGAAVKGVVERKAARVNGEREVDMDAVRELMDWAMPAAPPGAKGLEELLGLEALSTAL